MRLIRPALFARTGDAFLLQDQAQVLPYDRDSLPPGTPLPTRDDELWRALTHAGSIYVDASGAKLGDALLGLALVEALRDGASLLGLHRPVIASPDIADLLQVGAAGRMPDGAIRVSLARGSEGLLVADPDVLPPFRTSTQVFAALPSRYYLNLECRLGLRLPRDTAFLPTLLSRATDRHRPMVCYIDATSWPGKKDYGANGFACVARCIDATSRGEFDHILISGAEEDSRVLPPPLQPLAPAPGDLATLLAVFAGATLVIGNDTGLLHAAAMTAPTRRRGVIGIYGRHSYLRWTTGDPNHYAIATPFAQAMAAGDCCPVRDQINDQRHHRAAAVRRIPPGWIADCALRLLAEKDAG